MPFEVTDLRGADPSDPAAHLQDAFDAWILTFPEDMQSAYQRDVPPIVGAWTERTVVVVDSLGDDWIGDGGVTIVDAIWGSAPDAPVVRPWRVDDSDCADIFPIPTEVGFFRIQTTDPDFWFETKQPTTAAAYREAEAALTDVFGEPDRPTVDVTAQQEALDEVVAQADLDRLGPLDIRLIDSTSELALPASSRPTPAPDTRTVADPATEVVNEGAAAGDASVTDAQAASGESFVDSIPWAVILIGLAALAFGSYFAFRPLRLRRR